MSTQRKWQRILLLIVLGCEGAGALMGGTLLFAAPDGRLLDMSLTLLHGKFRDFSMPAVILFSLGVLNATAFFKLLLRKRSGWIWAGLSLGGMAIWFFVEIVVVQELHWLHVM
jgi:hypothetical protein